LIAKAMHHERRENGQQTIAGFFVRTAQFAHQV
jgi:hypothetical protein